MQLKSIINSELPEVKDLRQTVIRLGFCTVHMGRLTEKSADVKRRTFLLKLVGAAAKKPGEKVSVLTLGIQVIHYAERIKLGFIKRKQVLEKV